MAGPLKKVTFIFFAASPTAFAKLLYERVCPSLAHKLTALVSCCMLNFCFSQSVTLILFFLHFSLYNSIIQPCIKNLIFYNVCYLRKQILLCHIVDLYPVCPNLILYICFSNWQYIFWSYFFQFFLFFYGQCALLICKPILWNIIHMHRMINLKMYCVSKSCLYFYIATHKKNGQDFLTYSTYLVTYVMLVVSILCTLPVIMGHIL